jgi:hypothetical protein
MTWDGSVSNTLIGGYVGLVHLFRNDARTTENFI